MTFLNSGKRDGGRSRRIGGFAVIDTKAEVLRRLINRRLAAGCKTLLFFANANFVVQCQTLRRDMEEAPVIVVNDGVGMKLASLTVYGRPFRENLNGTDFVPFLLSGLARPTRIFLLGDAPHVVESAVDLIAQNPHVFIAGYSDGYGFRDRDIVAEINASGADLVLVGMGNPLQERWALDHYRQIEAPLIIGVGALFSWITGEQRRAPPAVRKLNLEWLYRLATEPRRLGRRYTIGILRFMQIVATQ